MSYPEMPTTALEDKFFFCEVCGKSLLSRRDITLCEVCGSQYRYSQGRMRLIRQGAMPSTSRLGLEQELELLETQSNIRIVVPPNTGQIMTVVGGSPLTGEITEIIIDFSDGCNGVVNIRAGVKQEQLAPSVGFIALNNVSQRFPVRKQVVFGERLWAEVQNGDPINPHTPSIIFGIRGYRKIWYR